LLLGAPAHARVALAQLDAVGLRLVDELLACPVQQSAVGRMCDRLGLHRRVHHDRRQARRLDRAAPLGRLDRLAQQPLHAFLADALSPAHQARRIARQLVPEIPLTAEVLVVRVLDPALDDFLVAQRVRVLQLQQPRYQPRRQRRPPRRRDELRTELPIEHRPVDQLGQPYQFVPRVDDVDQLLAEQVIDSRLHRRLGFHRSVSRNLQGFDAITAKTGRHRHPASPRNRLAETVYELFRAD